MNDAPQPREPAPALGAPSPVRTQERIEELDFVRGATILALLPGNMVNFVTPVYVQFAGTQHWTGPLDRLAEQIVGFVLIGKLYPLFAFLIGVGIMLQVEKTATGEPFVGRHLRRMGLLLLFGAAHALLLWYGDVLVLYAGLGIPLLLFLRRSSRTLLISALVFLSLPIWMTLGFVLWSDPAAQAQSWQQLQATLEALVARSVEVYSTGTFVEVTGQRLRDYLFLNSYVAMALPTIFSMLLFGLYAAKRGLFRDPERHAATWRVLLWGGLVVGLGGNAFLQWGPHLLPAQHRMVLQTALQVVAVPALSCFYLAASRALAVRLRDSPAVSATAAVGRTALSNYLLQSLIVTTLLYGYGGGLYGRLGPAQGIALALLSIVPLQVVLSVWWIRRYQFGPVEWLWRSGTYGRRQPLRVTAPRGPAPLPAPPGAQVEDS
jgi:uncharacterized protein